MNVQETTPFRLGSKWRAGNRDGEGDVITSINPADGSVAGVVTRALPKDVDEAVAAVMRRAEARRSASQVISSSIRWSFAGKDVLWITKTSSPRTFS